jgi:hypothetical protein
MMPGVLRDRLGPQDSDHCCRPASRDPRFVQYPILNQTRYRFSRAILESYPLIRQKLQIESAPGTDSVLGPLRYRVLIRKGILDQYWIPCWISRGLGECFEETAVMVLRRLAFF